MKIDNRGMTLLELIIALFIITLASIILITGLSTSTKVIQESHQYKNATNEQLASLTKQKAEEDVRVENKQDSIIVSIDGKQITIDGVLQTTSSKNFKDVSLTSFVIKDTKVNRYQEYYYKMIELFNKIKGMSKEQGQAYLEELKQESGISTDYLYSGWLRNDDFRVFAYLYAGFIEIDQEVIDECNTIYDGTHNPTNIYSPEAKARFGDKKMFIKPYRIEMGNDATDVLIMCAVPTNDLSTDQWRTSLIYNPSDESWYYKVFPAGDSAVESYLQLSSLKSEGVTWSVLQAQLQDPTQWQKLEYRSYK